MSNLSLGEWSKMYDREKITDYLPIIDYDNKNKIWITNDGGFGLIYDCSPLIYSSENSVNSLLSALQVLPQNAYVQVLLFGSPNVTDMVDSWEHLNTRNEPLAKELTKTYKTFLEKKVKEDITATYNSPLRNFRLILTVKIGGKENTTSLFGDIFKLNTKSFSKIFKKENLAKDVENDRKINNYELRKKYLDLLTIKSQLAGSLRQAGLMPEHIKPNKLIKFFYEVLNQNHDFRDTPKWDGSDFNNFLFANDNTVEVKSKEIVCDKKYIKTLSVKEYPEDWKLGDIIKYSGNILTNQNHSTPFIISMNIKKLNDKDGKEKIFRSAAATNSQQMPYSLFPKLKLIHKDLNYGMEKLQKGSIPYYFTMQIAIYGDTSEQVNNAFGRTKAYFKTLSFGLEEDNYVVLPSLLSMLPLGYDSYVQQFLGNERGRIVFAENIAELMPVCGEFLGQKIKVPLISSKGQLFGLDLFANKAGGFNAFTIGMTGSGKSVWLQWLALNYYIANNKIWIIDIGGSYKNMCESFGGQYIEFDKNDPVSLNPFTSITTKEMLDEYMEFIVSLYLLIGLPKSKNLSDEWEKLMKLHLNDAIEKSYDLHGIDSCVDSIIKELEIINENIQDSRVRDFISHLSLFSTGKLYGKVLNGKSSVSFEKDLIVLECGQLEMMPDLLNPVLMVLTFQISKEIYLAELNKANQDKKNIVIMDEAHKFLGKSEHIEMFIEQAYRRFRKHGASMIVGTQSYEDLLGDGGSYSKAGRVIIDNSYYNFFLMQKSTSREKIKQSGLYPMTDYEYSIFDSLAPVDGEYGEVYVITDKFRAKARIVLNKFLQAMLFTNAEDRMIINSFVEQGYTRLEAVKALEYSKKNTQR
ncbi:MAG: TraC family protein [Aliarcobacter sp.]|nr:TraC family protein [Aliarcobacter sp.]